MPEVGSLIGLSPGQFVLFLTSVIGFGIQLYREARNRKWDLEDRERARKELEMKVTQAQQTAATANQHVIAKIEENSEISRGAFKEANDVNRKIQALTQMMDTTFERRAEYMRRRDVKDRRDSSGLRDAVNEAKVTIEETKVTIDATKDAIDKTQEQLIILSEDQASRDQKLEDTKITVDETKIIVDNTQKKVDVIRQHQAERDQKLIDTNEKLQETKLTVDETKIVVDETHDDVKNINEKLS